MLCAHGKLFERNLRTHVSNVAFKASGRRRPSEREDFLAPIHPNAGCSPTRRGLQLTSKSSCRIESAAEVTELTLR